MADRVIVAIEDVKRRKNWKKCLFDSGESLDLTDEIILKRGLSVGAYITEKKYHTLNTESEIARGKEQGLRLLSYRTHSEKELKRRIHRSGLQQSTTDAVIDDLKRLHLVDDEEFARKFVHDLIRRKPVGEFLIRTELQKKGIPDAIIEQVIRQAFEQIDPVELARKGMQQWLSRHSQTLSGERRHKIAHFLYKRGFTRSVIEEIVGDGSAF